MDFDASKQAMINALNHQIEHLQNTIRQLRRELEQLEASRCEECSTPRYIVNEEEQLRLF